MLDTDAAFFAQHPDRKARIRLPAKEVYRDQQRAVRYLDESELQFRSLGPHDPKRRRIIAYRVPKDNPMYDPANPQILKLPMLLFADETVADDDKTLLPIVHQIMLDAAKANM